MANLPLKNLKLKVPGFHPPIFLTKRWNKIVSKKTKPVPFNQEEALGDARHFGGDSFAVESSISSSTLKDQRIVISTPNLLSSGPHHHKRTTRPKRSVTRKDVSTFRQKAVALLLTAFGFSLFASFVFPESKTAKAFTAASFYALVVVHMF
ncbi:hypothetical_protein [Candidozyma auris]|uniref:hypothetical_protein n=1 Tax=Candidozyma auris TaxID=498019 RepID=UPI000D2E91C6|nr:hypothetical_protein [[Candida] auris]QEO24501.1 hypothetical_protein [[Candida] auris]